MPLPVRDLVDAGRADDAMSRALVAKRNPVIEAVRAQDRADGKAEGRVIGKAESVLDVLALRKLPVDGAARARILGEQDVARLERWLKRALSCATVAELFAEP